MNKEQILHVFFIRSDNDLDHIAPILLELRSKGNIKIINRNPLKELYNDKRIEFISNSNIEIIETSSINSKFFYKILLALRWLYSMTIKSNFNKIVVFNRLLSFLVRNQRKLLFKLRDLLEERLDLDDIFDKKQYKKKTFSADYSNDKFLKKTLKYCSKRKIKTFAFPHSINHLKGTLAGDSFNLTESNPFESFKETFFQFDIIFVPNKEIYSRIFHLGVPVEKIKIIGSFRFSKRWIETLREVYFEKGIEFGKLISQEKTIVVFVLSKFLGHLNEKELFRIIDALASNSSFQIFLKPHSRLYFQSIPSRILKKVILIEHDIPTFIATDLSDVIFFWGSSFFYDPLVQGKKILQLKYIFSLDCDFEKYLKEIQIRSRDELVEFLSLVKSGKDPLSAIKRKECIRETLLDNLNEQIRTLQEAYGI